MTLPRRVLPNSTYLVTRRCLRRRFLLRPDRALNTLFLYCLAVAADRYGVAIHGFCVMSNHYHLVLTDMRGELPVFMGWLNSQLAKRIKQLRAWDEVVWEPNVHYSAVELEGQAEVLDKIVYTLLNPVSAELVEQPADWPGAISTLPMLRRGKLEVKRPEARFRKTLPELIALSLTPAPCFTNEEQYLSALESLLDRRTRRLQGHRSKRGRRVLGRRHVLQTPFSARSTTPKERFGRSPTFSALTRGAWQRAVKRLRAFRAAYRRAYQAWRSGVSEVEFPAGTWWLTRCANVRVVRP